MSGRAPVAQLGPVGGGESFPPYAVTPTDTRQPPRPAAAHPANMASREHSALLMNLAIQIADAEVHGIVEMYAFELVLDDKIWFDTSLVPMDMRRHAADRDFAASTVARAIRYIDLRSPDAFPWRFIRHPEQPHLVRFEATP